MAIICGVSMIHYTFGLPGLVHIIINMALVVVSFHLALLSAAKHIGFLLAGICIGSVITQRVH